MVAAIPGAFFSNEKLHFCNFLSAENPKKYKPLVAGRILCGIACAGSVDSTRVFNKTLPFIQKQPKSLCSFKSLSSRPAAQWSDNPKLVFFGNDPQKSVNAFRYLENCLNLSFLG